jgi:hypothetical protein
VTHPIMCRFCRGGCWDGASLRNIQDGIAVQEPEAVNMHSRDNIFEPNLIARDVLISDFLFRSHCIQRSQKLAVID